MTAERSVVHSVVYWAASKDETMAVEKDETMAGYSVANLVVRLVVWKDEMKVVMMVVR